MASSCDFWQNIFFTGHLLLYPREMLLFLSPSCSILCQEWFLISSHSLNKPAAFCLLLFFPSWLWYGQQMGSLCHRGVTRCLPVTQACALCGWCSSGLGLVVTQRPTSPCIEGLDKEKGRTRALRQHVFPLINGHFGVERKSNETWNKAVTEMYWRIHSVIILLGSEYYVANIFVLLLAGVPQLVLGPL